MKKIISTIFVVLFALSLFTSVSATPDYAYLAEVTSTNYLPTSIHAGDVISLSLDVYNRAKAIDIVDLNITLDIGNQFEEVQLNDTIDLIKPGTTKTVTFKFRVKKNVVPGYYSVYYTLTYNRKGEFVTQKATAVAVPVSRIEENIEVTVSPSVLNPGNQEELVFTLKNIGGTPVSNISFSWDEKNDLILPLGSNNKRYASLLEPNKSVELKYIVAADPNIVTGIYPIDITVTFIDENGTRSETSKIGLIIGGKTDFEISAEVLSTGQLSLSIANIGSNNADAIVVKVLKPQEAGIIGTNTQILGNLDRGDYTLANFEMSQSSTFVSTSTQTAPTRGLRLPGMGRTRQTTTALDHGTSETQFSGLLQGSSEITIQISYTDTTGERQIVEKTLDLSSQTAFRFANNASQIRNTGSSLLSAGLLILILAAAIVFNKFKARRGWKSLGKVLGIIAVLFIANILLLQSNQLAAYVIAVISIVYLLTFFKEIDLKEKVISLKNNFGKK